MLLDSDDCIFEPPFPSETRQQQGMPMHADGCRWRTGVEEREDGGKVSVVYLVVTHSGRQRGITLYVRDADSGPELWVVVPDGPSGSRAVFHRVEDQSGG